MIAASEYGVPLLVLVVILQWRVEPHANTFVTPVFAAGLSFLLGSGLNQLILLFIHYFVAYDARNHSFDNRPQQRLVVPIRPRHGNYCDSGGIPDPAY